MLPDLILIKAIVTLFIILDPLGNVPIFISLTQSASPSRKKKIFHLATIVAFILLLIFGLAGQQILILFGISLHEFMIAGGILLLLLSMKTLFWGERHKVITEEVGAVPIATPLLVGPGTITATIVLLETTGLFVTMSSILINFLIIVVMFRFIENIHKFLGKVGAMVMNRIMAIFLAAIAVGFIIEGIRIVYSL